MFPAIVSSMVEAKVSFNRITKFLLAEELDPNAVERPHASASIVSENAMEIHGKFHVNVKHFVTVKRGYFFMGSKERQTNTIRHFCEGILVAIFGYFVCVTFELFSFPKTN